MTDVCAEDLLMALSVDRQSGRRLQVLPQPVIAHSKLFASGASALLVEAGDFFSSLGKKITTSIRSLIFKVVNGINEMLVQIGDKMYRALLDALASIAHAAEWVFDQIKVLADDLTAFLGFLFQGPDVIRTQRVIMNLLKQSAGKAVTGIDNVEKTAIKGLDRLDAKLNAWGVILDTKTTIGSSIAQGNTNDPGSSSPQANGDQLIANLTGLASDQFAALQTAHFDPNHQERRCEEKSLDIINILIDAAFELMDAPISVPVLSPFYQSIIGNSLNLLDGMCFVAAIPATLIYKVI
ncbi:MAG: hypothetical protein Q9183_001253 [Haloplaca sp. 2 TL-2023]